MQDFIDAIKNIQKSVSKEQLKDYSEWMNLFGSVWTYRIMSLMLLISTNLLIYHLLF